MHDMYAYATPTSVGSSSAIQQKNNTFIKNTAEALTDYT